MTLRQFQWRMQARGATLAAWPSAERCAALALLRGDARARALLAETLLTEAGEEAGERDDAALARMRRRVRAQAALRATAAPALAWGMRGSAIAACLAAGLWVGGLVTAEADGLAAVQLAALDILP